MKKLKLGFTLLEITVAIALIWIIIIWGTKLNFNSLSNKQRLDWFFYKIKTNIETVKNNTLIWKTLKNWNKIIVSEKWQIDFNNSGSGIIKTYYYDRNFNKKEYNFYDTIPKKYYSINTTCKKINSKETQELKGTGSIIINWSNLKLTSWCSSDEKELKIKIKYKNKEKRFTINTISWVIEEELNSYNK
jgi:hypothetical protein